MKLQFLNKALIMVVGLTLAACSGSDDATNEAPVSNDGKFIIQLGESSANSAVTRAGFTVATDLNVHIVSDLRTGEDAVNGSDGTGKANTLYASTIANAANDATPTADTYSSVTTSGNFNRYWDDMHGRNSALSVYAIAVPGKIQSALETLLKQGGSANPDWTSYKSAQTTMSNTVNWKVSTTQNSTNYADEDLVYSNNLRKVSDTDDTRLKFVSNAFEKASSTNSPNKALVFNHALTRFTFNITEGDGFDGNKTSSSTDFQLTAISLDGFNVSGTFDVPSGAWTSTTPNTTGTPINIIGHTGTVESGYQYKYHAQVIPGTNLNDGTNANKDMLNITIDNNTYRIKGSEIHTALVAAINTHNTGKAITDPDYYAAFDKLLQGFHYIINMTIKKTSVELQAKLVPWNEVSGTITGATNARFDISNIDTDASVASKIKYDVYRAVYTTGGTSDDAEDYTKWVTGYNTNQTGAGTAGHITIDGTGSSFTYPVTTTWLWPDNKTFYHFRSVAPFNTTVNTEASAGDYVNIQGGEVPASEGTGKDYIWGAPFKKDNINSTTRAKDLYSTETGFSKVVSGSETQLFQAIGATNSTITLTQFHMMSKIQVTISSAASPADVDLTNAVVTLEEAYNNGNFLMGTGKVTATGAKSSSTTPITFTRTTNTTTSSIHNYLIVPQAKSGIKLVITVAGNRYEANLPDIDSAPNLLPGDFYQYTVTLSKKGIETLQAKLVEWNTVTGDIGIVDLE